MITKAMWNYAYMIDKSGEKSIDVVIRENHFLKAMVKAVTCSVGNWINKLLVK